MVAEEEVNSAHHTKGTQTFMEAIKELSEEGGDSMPNKVGKQGPQFATIVEKSATPRSAKKEEMCRLPQADNS